MLRKYTSTFNEIYDDYIHVFHVMIISLISLKHCNNSYACLICLETHYGSVVLITGLQFQKQLILIKKLLFQNLEHIGYEFIVFEL